MRVLTSDTVRVDETNGDQVMLGVQVTPVRYRQRLMRDWMANGPPDVNDAHAPLQKAVSIRTEMSVHACDARVVRLVDMDAFLVATSSILVCTLLLQNLLTTGPRSSCPGVGLVPGFRLTKVWNMRYVVIRH